MISVSSWVCTLGRGRRISRAYLNETLYPVVQFSPLYRQRKFIMNQIIYLVGLVVIVIAILSFLGLA